MGKWIWISLMILIASTGLVSQDRIEPDMILVAGGEFTMGSEDGNEDEEPVHGVGVSSFYLGRTEVSQALWESVMGSNPSENKNPAFAAGMVSWYDAVRFCNMLSKRDGLTPCYSGMGEIVTCDFAANGYRLPTEAEWAFAARGGNASKGYRYAGSNSLDEVGWYHDNCEGTEHAIGLKRSNELGFFDMSGGQWEWCWDWYAEYPKGAQVDPRGPQDGETRIIRGGTWNIGAEGSRVSRRGDWCADCRSFNTGLRLCRTAMKEN